MKKRLAEDFGIKHVEVRTFHSYGVRLLTKFKPDTPTDPPKQAEVGQEVKKILEDLLKNDRTFAKLVLDYAVEISDTTKEEADLKTRRLTMNT
jgi:superfamily I DNA/RNA helicase